MMGVALDRYLPGRNHYKFEGVLATNCLMPAVEFTLEYTVVANELTVSVSYKLADYIERFPRFGFEFGVDKGHCNFSYVGFGPMESYFSDKVMLIKLHHSLLTVFYLHKKAAINA